MHRFPQTTTPELPERFTDPFRYAPHPLVRAAAGIVMNMMDRINTEGEGKMLGVLVVRDRSGELGFLAGFSGSIGGRSIIEGFVPPVFDLLDSEGEFKKREAGITRLNKAISAAENAPEFIDMKQMEEDIRKQMEADLERMKREMALAKEARMSLRKETDDPQTLKNLEKESQFAKAEFRRRKNEWSAKLEEAVAAIGRYQGGIDAMKNARAVESDSLQRWIFDQYVVMNAEGRQMSVNGIFSRKGITAPGGTGDCAAPKLLDYAFRNGCQPLAMGEFWYGKASQTAVRVHGHFYPSCTSKCGPLLNYMLEGTEYGKEYDIVHGEPVIIYEDNDIAVVSKPSGMPSVPGLDNRISIHEWLSAKDGPGSFLPVHRLDMDTSGIMLFAKNAKAMQVLQNQFESHTIRKTYMARLSPSDQAHEKGFTRENILEEGSVGEISLPLSPDYDERPRQKVDRRQGKPSRTTYRVTANRSDGTTDILMSPETGRTHQLRVHSAHFQGLARPIAGDLLYGGSPSERLCLHAFSIGFVHPSTRQPMQFETLENCYI